MNRSMFTLTVTAAALLLAGCGKKPTPPPAPPASTEPATAAPAENDAPATKGTEKSITTKAPDGDTPQTEAASSSPNKPKHKYARLTGRELLRLTHSKTIPEVVDALGEPIQKKRHLTQYTPDCWLYEWDIVVEEDSETSEYFGKEYPRIGIVFETSTSPAKRWYLDEYLPGHEVPQ